MEYVINQLKIVYITIQEDYAKLAFKIFSLTITIHVQNTEI